MENKKVLILIVLAVFAVISIIYGITAPAKGKAGRPVMSPVEKHPAPQKGMAPVERRAKRSRFTSWTRSPFVPVGGSGSSNLVLSGIIWNKERPKAMIGDDIVGKGDKIGDKIVMDIRQDKVILNDGTKNIELKLEK